MAAIIERIVASGHGRLSPSFLAVHSTANPGATAENHASYWSGAGADYAVHLVSDWERCLHCVPYDRLCWQVGNGNSMCEGIEICEATNEADFLRGLEVARAAILERLDAHGWTVDGNVRSHLWFTQTYGGSDHTDPIPYLERFGWTWERFIGYLKEGDYMPTVEEIWSYEINGVQARDRLQGTDEAANVARAQLTRTDDPSGRGIEMDMPTHLKYIAAKQAAMDEKIDGIVSMVASLVAQDK